MPGRNGVVDALSPQQPMQPMQPPGGQQSLVGRPNGGAFWDQIRSNGLGAQPRLPYGQWNPGYTPLGMGEVSVNGYRPMGLMSSPGMWGGGGGWGAGIGQMQARPVGPATGYGSDSDAHGSSAGWGGGSLY